MNYIVSRCEQPVSTDANWNAAHWQDAEIAEISNFRPESSPHHRPRASARLMVSDTGLHGIFNVQGELARCTRTEYFDDVWKDSCVEFFVQPRPDLGYFNFEFNCGGAFLCSYVTDPTRTPEGGLTAVTRIPKEQGRFVQVASSLPPKVDPESTQPCDWTLGFFIPLRVFAPYVGEVSAAPGERWKCNFYKCAEEVSNPHWASWSPVPELNFHMPGFFGDLAFE